MTDIGLTAGKRCMIAATSRGLTKIGNVMSNSMLPAVGADISCMALRATGR